MAVRQENLTAFPFRKGHRRQMRKEDKILLCLLPLSKDIKVMDDESETERIV